MSVLSGFITGTLALAGMEMLVTSPNAAGQISALGQFSTVVIDRVVNPDLPALGTSDFVAPPPFTAPATPDDPAQPATAEATPQPASSPQLTSTKPKPPRPVPSPTRLGGPR